MTTSDPTPAAQDRLRQADLAARRRLLGLTMAGDTAVVPFFALGYRVRADTSVLDADGRPPAPAVTEVIAAYLLDAAPVDRGEPQRLVSFREFEGAGHLIQTC